MLAFGFSLNMMTLLGLILAIGIVVDDAIVVVENVERIMNEEHLSPYELTKKPGKDWVVPLSPPRWCYVPYSSRSAF